MKTLGIILIVAGIAMIVIKGFSVRTEKKVVDIGPVEINKKEKRLCLEITLSNLAYNVSFAADNNYDKLISSGFNVNKAEDYKQVKDAEKSKQMLQKNYEQNMGTFLFHPATA